MLDRITFGNLIFIEKFTFFLCFCRYVLDLYEELIFIPLIVMMIVVGGVFVMNEGEKHDKESWRTEGDVLKEGKVLIILQQ